MRRRRIVPGLLVLLASLGVPHMGGASVPNPIVEGPISGGIRGHAWNASLYDIAPYGYVEEEFFYGGLARTRGPLAPIAAPYKSRMIVKRPADPAAFNGTVIVEWLNVTGGTDLETVWPVAWEFLVRNGFAYVGVSAQLAGLCCGPLAPKGWDPLRYATIFHPGDEYSYDIFSQAMKALRDPLLNRTTIGTPKPVDPLGGLKLQHIAAGGASQSASRLTSYINEGYDAEAGLVDVFNITRGGGPYDDLTTPILQLNEEGQDELPADNDRYRLWEEAGTSHAPAAWWNYIWAMQMRDAGTPSVPDAVTAACSTNRGSVDYSARAGLWWTHHFLTTGELPPSIPRIERDADGSVRRDANGLAVGGMRHPFVQVPVAYNSGEGCPLWGLYKSWPAEKITALYATHADYVSKVTAWAQSEVALGWLLPDDAADVIAKAEAFDGPWGDASCYDTYNATGNEDGPLSSAVYDLSFDPSLPLGTQSALRDVSCNALVPIGL
ncbi:MAG: alpha/beta hydrolase domain-containing protein [Actinomycetota bacterium]